jgi:dye decolorizing peroxidase
VGRAQADAPASADGDAGSASEPALNGPRTVPFLGTHQAGIETPAPAHALVMAWDLTSAEDAGRARTDLTRLMRILSDDAARLTQGQAALADTEPELARNPANLTVTFGFGPALLDRVGVDRPTGADSLPGFSIDELDESISDGDLLIQVCSDDPLVLAHTSRMLAKDTRAFGSQRWMQSGFRRAHGSEKPGTTMRNTFGQVDGSANPALDSADFTRTVWIPDGPFAGGTTLVVRLIRMDLDLWDEADRVAREQSVGRTLDVGAPLGGTGEFDTPDFSATGPNGFAVIPEFSHMRRARGVDEEDGGQQIYRRSYNVEQTLGGGAIGADGQLFLAFQADAAAQFVPIQKRLAELDLLNQWTTPVGSALFVLPPGSAEGEYVGQGVLEP